MQYRALSLPIPHEAVKCANQFASRQPTPECADRVRLNTLAIYTVHDYLQMMQIPTDLRAGDSWNPVMQLCADTADLEIVGLGRLECRPMRAGEPCWVPPEVWHDRIGYVVVQVDETAREAQLLGFTETVTAEILPLSQLRPLDALLHHLHQLKPLSRAVEGATAQRTRLSQWLQGVMGEGWQPVEAVLNLSNRRMNLAFRSHPGDSSLLHPVLRRAKRLEGVQLHDPSIALLVEVMPDEEQRSDICVQVHPIGDPVYLPPNVTLTILDESGTAFLEAQSRQADNYLQIRFSGLPGEPFSVQVTLDDRQFLEQFEI